MHKFEHFTDRLSVKCQDNLNRDRYLIKGKITHRHSSNTQPQNYSQKEYDVTVIQN